GVILVDPPFEEPGELERIAQGLQNARRRFAGGVYVLWYPIKDSTLITRFRRTIAAIAPPETLDIELLIRAPGTAGSTVRVSSSSTRHSHSRQISPRCC